VGKIEAEKAYAKALKRATPAEILAGLESKNPISRTQVHSPPGHLAECGRWLIRPSQLLAERH
jgi:hypothetical protein